MQLVIIEEGKYDKLVDVDEIFLKKEDCRSYGFIINSEGLRVKISWRSDIIKPDIFIINDLYFLIGIDNNFTIMESNSLKVVVNLSTQFLYLESKIINNILLVATELEVMLFDLEDFLLIENKNLPDIYQSSTYKDNLIFIECLDDFEYKLNEL